MKKISALLLVFLLSFSLFASFKYRVEADISASGVLNIPTAEYLENAGSARPSAAAGADLNPVGFSAGKISLSAGISFALQSRTQPYRNLVLKGFAAFGPDVKVLYRMEKDLSLSLKGRILFCTLLNSRDKFLAFSAEAALGYRLGKKNKSILDLNLPLSVTFRKDIISVNLGLGLTVHGDF